MASIEGLGMNEVQTGASSALFGSWRHTSVSRGGVILYLAQEGRGLGLANKMRTYRLQDNGLDTFDANTTLGFDDDERDYGIAARMLRMLNCTRIVLLTNNPAKLNGLTKAGIAIDARVPLEAPINADNRRYLTAKAVRSGHRFDNLEALLANQP
jgi:GTP cyclohydrolase II